MAKKKRKKEELDPRIALAIHKMIFANAGYLQQCDFISLQLWAAKHGIHLGAEFNCFRRGLAHVGINFDMLVKSWVDTPDGPTKTYISRGHYLRALKEQAHLQ